MKKTLNWLFDYPNLKVYQFEEGFKFSLDSILLAEFAEIKKEDTKIIELCTGNAVVPIILSSKYQKNIVGVEIQPEIYDLAVKSVAENNLGNNISIINDSVLNLKNYFPGNNFQVVLCNPPYFKYVNDSKVNENYIKRVARHEITVTLEEIIEIASFLLNNKGRFYMVHVPDRVDEIFVYANKHGMAVKELQFVHSKMNEKPIIVLVCLVKSGKFGTKVYPPLCIKDLTSYQNIFRK